MISHQKVLINTNNLLLYYNNATSSIIGFKIYDLYFGGGLRSLTVRLSSLIVNLACAEIYG